MCVCVELPSQWNSKYKMRKNSNENCVWPFFHALVILFGWFLFKDCSIETVCLTYFTAVTSNTRPERFFLRLQTCVLVDVNQPLPWFFARCPRADSFPVSRALGRTCLCLSRFCNILLQDPAQLHVNITRSTNLLSVCRRKLKLSTYTHCKLQLHKLSQCTLATRLSSC